MGGKRLRSPTFRAALPAIAAVLACQACACRLNDGDESTAGAGDGTGGNATAAPPSSGSSVTGGTAGDAPGDGTAGASGSGADTATVGDSAGPSGDGGETSGGTTDGLDEAEGCPGVFNPDQILDYHFTLDAADWSTIQSDLTYEIMVPAELECDGEAITVGLRRKRSGGTNKVGLKVDINQQVPGQKYYGLKKLNLENGISSGSPGPSSIGALVEEFLAWRIMTLSGAISSRAAFAQVFVNGESFGTYVNVEQVDKTFLKGHLGDDSGWLWKKSGGAGDGQKTNEGVPDPYADYFCFWVNGGGSCAAPDAGTLARELLDRLDIAQMLRVGAVNALIANTDAPLVKDNNYYFYDSNLGRVYLPWDLDTAMKQDYDVFTGTVGGSTEMYRDVLFSNWEGEYDDILTDLLASSLSLSAIDGELDRIADVGATALDADPWVEGGSTAAVVDDLRAWWALRHEDVQAQVDAH